MVHLDTSRRVENTRDVTNLSTLKESHPDIRKNGTREGNSTRRYSESDGIALSDSVEYIYHKRYKLNLVRMTCLERKIEDYLLLGEEFWIISTQLILALPRSFFFSVIIPLHLYHLDSAIP